jgi:hypothetical protein
LTGRQRFEEALAGRAVAFAPIVWERLPELVHQPSADWWQDAAIGQRLLTDVAGLAVADAVFVLAALDAAQALSDSGARGDDALDALAGTPEARCGYELVAQVSSSRPFGVIAGVPDIGRLQAQFGAEEREAAEDALSDLARGYLDAGADALAVIGTDTESVEAAAQRVATVGDFYGRPVLAIRERGDTIDAWLQSASRSTIAVVGVTGEWPGVAAGLVITPGDVSARWDAARLRAVGTARDGS